MLDGTGEGALAFVVTGLLRQVGKCTGQGLVGEAKEAAFRRVVEKGFHDGQDNEFHVADAGLVSRDRAGGQELGAGVEVVVGGDINCKVESVQVVFHKFDP